MRYLSFCSGIGGAEVAWQPLGWKCKLVCETNGFASAVLAHHGIGPNMGELRAYTPTRSDRAADLVVAGTPCPSFSLGGAKSGLSDPRGQLLLEYCRVVGEVRPRWVVWENVTGVLSNDKGRALSTFLGRLGRLGYRYAWRVLDAQYFGLAQRRRRVFLVAHRSDWRGPAAVLLEPEGMRGDPPACEEAEAQTLRRPRTGHGSDGPQGELIATPDPAYCVSAHHGRLDKEETRVIYRGERARRLTPLEYERLQGFPDGWTDVRFKNRKASDAARITSVGNAFPVPVMRWIGQRIQKVDELL